MNTLNKNSDKTYYIFRHGKAIPDGEEYGEDNRVLNLLPEGEESIKRLAKFLAINTGKSANFSSEWKRCKQTSGIVAEATGKTFTFDSRLNEFDKETFDNVVARSKNFLEEINKLSDKTFLICTHGMIIATLKHLIIDGHHEIENQFDFPLAGELLIIKNGQKIEKISFNEV